MNRLINILKSNPEGWLLFALAFVLYANTIGHGYVWDDSIVITENTRVQRGLVGIPDLFVKHHSDYKADKYGYRPITLSSFALEYSLFKNKPAVSHFMNVLYFALLCLVIFNVLLKLMGRDKRLFVFLTTLVFALHPLHCEVVANIKSRDEIFALLFGMLALGSLVDYLQNTGIVKLVRVGVFFLLAFLSKENSIVFIPILLLAAMFHAQGFRLKKQWGLLAGLALLLGLSFGVYTYATTAPTLAKASDGAGIYHENGLLGNSFFYTDLFSQKLANAFTLLLLYLKNFFYPLRQLYFYGYNQIPVSDWSSTTPLLSVLLYLGLAIVAVFSFKKNHWFAFGLLFYLVGISVYLHLFRTLADTMADRFLFIPSLGLCIVTVSGVMLFARGLSELSLQKFFALKNPLSGTENNLVRWLFLLFCFVLSLKTISRNRVWKDTFTLVSTDMPWLENCARAHNYYADELKRRYPPGTSAAYDALIEKHYKRAIAITSEAYYAYIGLGMFYNQKNQYAQSIEVFTQMLEKYPTQADAQYYLGEAYTLAGQAPEAIALLKESARLAPRVAITYITLARAQVQSSLFAEADNTLENYRKQFGSDLRYYETRAELFYKKGEAEAATRNLLETINYGADAQLVYKVAIGRCQSLKQDSLAALLYNDALQKGILRR